MSDDYVKPPSKNDDYVKPTSSKEEVVKPASNSDDYVKPPSATKNNAHDDYVKPPQKGSQDYNAGKNSDNKRAWIIKGDIKPSEYKKPTKGPAPMNNENKSKDPYDNPSYFGTPKVGIGFYINSYIIISILYTLFISKGDFASNVFAIIYFLISNYTYSWYADYKRYKGEMLWLFNPYGTIKLAGAASLFMDPRKGTVKKGMFGNLKVDSSRSITKTLLIFIVVLVITEILKYFINFFVAFASLFFHKSTIRKYNEAVDQANR